MCFLMAMEEEPVRSFSSAMAVKIAALYDMATMFALNCTGRETKFNQGNTSLESWYH